MNKIMDSAYMPHITGVAVLVILVGCFPMVFNYFAGMQPTEEDTLAVITKNGCKPTNEFVGKEGDRLYLCSDGKKYKYEGFRQLAYRQLNSSK